MGNFEPGLWRVGERREDRGKLSRKYGWDRGHGAKLNYKEQTESFQKEQSTPAGGVLLPTGPRCQCVWGGTQNVSVPFLYRWKYQHPNCMIRNVKTEQQQNPGHISLQTLSLLSWNNKTKNTTPLPQHTVNKSRMPGQGNGIKSTKQSLLCSTAEEPRKALQNSGTWPAF